MTTTSMTAITTKDEFRDDDGDDDDDEVWNIIVTVNGTEFFVGMQCR